MSITKSNPNTIFLGGTRVQVNTEAASATITPGDLIERFNNSGVWRWRRQSTADVGVPLAIATEQSMLNKGVDDDYAANDLVEASIMQPGAAFWAFIASGQNIAFGNKLQASNDGTLKIFASGVVLAVALETKATVSTKTRIRVEAL
jgi:hypothetical protein